MNLLKSLKHLRFFSVFALGLISVCAVAFSLLQNNVFSDFDKANADASSDIVAYYQFAGSNKLGYDSKNRYYMSTDSTVSQATNFYYNDSASAWQYGASFNTSNVGRIYRDQLGETITDFCASNNFTFCFDLKWDANIGSGGWSIPVCFGFQISSWEPSGSAFQINNNGHLYLSMTGINGCTGWFGHDIGNMNDHNIHRIVFSFNQYSNYDVYFDGNQVISRVCEQAFPVNAGYFALGNYLDRDTYGADPADYTWNGTIAQVKLYSGAMNYDQAIAYTNYSGIQYTQVQYNTMGGDALSTTTFASLPNGYKITDAIPTRAGYTFQNWNLKSDYSGQTFTAGVSTYQQNAVVLINAASNNVTTLYARWTANTNTRYYVKHYFQNITNNSYTLNNTYTETCYGTTGTTTSVSSYKSVTGFTGSSITNVTITGDGNACVSVYYNRNTYSVTVNKNENDWGSVSNTPLTNVRYGSTVSTNGNTVSVNSGSITSSTATPATNTSQYTYSFSSWTIPNSTVTGNMTVTANFACVENSYNVTFQNGAYGSWNSTTTINATYSTNITINGNSVSVGSSTRSYSLSRTGYDCTSTILVGGYNANTTVGTGKAITVNESYVPHTTSITYSYPTGFSGTASSVATYDSNLNNTPTGNSKTGYTFNGYYLSNSISSTKLINANGSLVSGVSGYTNASGNWIKDGGTLTLYGIWSAHTTSISFDKQGGSGGSDSTTATFDQALTTITVPGKDGYTFGGYYDDASGNNTKYYNGDGTSAHNWDKDISTSTLYAKWNSIQFTLSSDNTQMWYTQSNSVKWYTDTSLQNEVSTATYGQTLYVTATPNTGYQIPSPGYFTVVLNSTNFAKDNSDWRSAGTVTMYHRDAIPKTITINFSLNSDHGTLGTETIYLKYNTGYYSDSACTQEISQLPTNPSSLGYYFQGYSYNSILIVDGTGVIVGSTTALSNNPSEALPAAWNSAESTAEVITFISDFNSGCNCKKTGNKSSEEIAQLEEKFSGEFATSYGALDANQKYWFAENNAQTNALIDMLQRYDYVVNRYNTLTDFLGRKSTDANPSLLANVYTEEDSMKINSVIILSCAAGGLLLLSSGLFVLIKKKKHNA